MSKHEYDADAQFSITVERADDEYGGLTITIKANDDVLTINAGRFQEDADQLRGELEGAADATREIQANWEDRPNTESDGFVSSGRDGYYATLEGKTRPDGRQGYPSQDIATYELARLMAETSYTPNAWYEGERGIDHMINAEVLAYLGDDDKLKPLPGVKYAEGDIVSLADSGWSTWVVDGDYGDFGVMVHTSGDPDVSTLATHDQLTPYDDEDDEA